MVLTPFFEFRSFVHLTSCVFLHVSFCTPLRSSSLWPSSPSPSPWPSVAYLHSSSCFTTMGAPPPWVLMRCGFLRGLVCPFIKESGETFVVVDLNPLLCNQKLMFLLVLCARSVVLLLFLRGFLWVLRFADVAMSFSFYDDADGDDSWSTVALVVYAWDFSLEIWIL